MTSQWLCHCDRMSFNEMIVVHSLYTVQQKVADLKRENARARHVHNTLETLLACSPFEINKSTNKHTKMCVFIFTSHFSFGRLVEEKQLNGSFLSRYHRHSLPFVHTHTHTITPRPSNKARTHATHTAHIGTHTDKQPRGENYSAKFECQNAELAIRFTETPRIRCLSLSMYTECKHCCILTFV